MSAPDDLAIACLLHAAAQGLVTALEERPPSVTKVSIALQVMKRELRAAEEKLFGLTAPGAVKELEEAP